MELAKLRVEREEGSQNAEPSPLAIAEAERVSSYQS